MKKKVFSEKLTIFGQVYCTTILSVNSFSPLFYCAYKKERFPYPIHVFSNVKKKQEYDYLSYLLYYRKESIKNKVWKICLENVYKIKI